MQFGEFKFSKIQIMGVLILLIGLSVGVYLVKQQQTLKSKASSSVDVTKAFYIKNADTGADLTCTPANGSEPATCTTSSTNVNIKVKDLNELLK